MDCILRTLEFALAAANAYSGIDPAMVILHSDCMHRAEIGAGSTSGAKGQIRKRRFKVTMEIERKNTAVVRTEDATAIPATVAYRHFRIIKIFILMKHLVHGAFGLKLAHQCKRLRF
jgi:hypothetical protein